MPGPIAPGGAALSEITPYVLAVYGLIGGLFVFIFNEQKKRIDTAEAKITTIERDATDKRDALRRELRDEHDKFTAKQATEHKELIAKVEKDRKELEEKLDSHMKTVVERLDGIKESMNTWAINLTRDYVTRQEFRELIAVVPRAAGGHAQPGHTGPLPGSGHGT
jgi:flagellar motility protein MotE (MotC chaperone)